MNDLRKSIVVFLFSVMVVLHPRLVPAMELQMFDSMAVQDQDDYLRFLIKTAQKALVEQGRLDLAKKAEQVFRSESGGEAQFRANLDRYRAFVMKDGGKFFSPLVGQTEDVFIATLNENGIPSYSPKFRQALLRLIREKPYWPKRLLNQ